MYSKVIYTNWFIPSGFGAITLGPLILIRKSKKGDAGLVEHEKVHVRQFWQTWGLFWFFYLLSKKRRAAFEAEAYREQLKYNPENREKYAGWIINKYKTGLTMEEAMKSLEEPVEKNTA